MDQHKYHYNNNGNDDDNDFEDLNELAISYYTTINNLRIPSYTQREEVSTTIHYY